MRTRTVIAISALLLMAMLMVAAQSTQEGESNAVNTMRTINTAQAAYMRAYSDTGYACDIANLGPDPKGGAASSKNANLLDKSVTGGKEHNAYIFKVECKDKTKPQTEYRSSAVPAKKSSARAFCSDQSGVIKSSADGDAKACFASGELVK